MNLKTTDLDNSKRNIILSPLRYPGSKRRLAGYIASAIKLNTLSTKLLIEVFTGGASVSLQLLNNSTVQSVGFIELDPLVAAFWQTIFSSCDEDREWLKEQVQHADINLDTWNELRKNPPTTTREQAWACLFLNRTSFSGILAPGAGPIGGHRQNSQYKIDCRFPRETLLKRIDQAALLRDKVQFVWNSHWRDGLKNIFSLQSAGKLPNDSIYYFDPPFFHNAERLYRHYFNKEDHEELHAMLMKLNAPWILSYDHCAEVHELYNEKARTQVELLYSAGSNGGGIAVKEVIVTNLPQLPPTIRLWRTSKEWKNGF